MFDISELATHWMHKEIQPSFSQTILFSIKGLFSPCKCCGFCQIVKWKTRLKFFSHADSRRGCDYHLMKREIIWTTVQNSNCCVLNNLHTTADQTSQTYSREVWVSASAINLSISRGLPCHQNMVD